MRSVHLYLGCFFAPLLIFFIVTGCWQMYDLHQLRKSSQGYQPPRIVRVLSGIHLHQQILSETAKTKPSPTFRYFVVLMSFGVLVTTMLGVLMAFKFTQPWIVWGCLLLGSLIPVLLLWAAR